MKKLTPSICRMKADDFIEFCHHNTKFNKEHNLKLDQPYSKSKIMLNILKTVGPNIVS